MRKLPWAFLALLACIAAARDVSAQTIRIYVAGESIERRNHFVEPPFLGDGRLNDRGGGELRNDNEEYGWMVPLADRLRLRDAAVTVEWIGTETWLDGDDFPYTGTYPSTTPGATSAISGTSIDSWLEQRRGELEARTHCYDVAFASRGGNDFGLDNDDEFKRQLKELIVLLANGSNCVASPMIYVTGHLPDDQRGGSGDPTDPEYVALQLQRFVNRTREAVEELQAEQPELRLRFIDMYTPFLENTPSTAFPDEVWSSGGIPDYAKIGREGDLMHPRRLASIFAGEIAADRMDIPGVASPTPTPTPGDEPTATPTEALPAAPAASPLGTLLLAGGVTVLSLRAAVAAWAAGRRGRAAGRGAGGR